MQWVKTRITAENANVTSGEIIDSVVTMLEKNIRAASEVWPSYLGNNAQAEPSFNDKSSPAESFNESEWSTEGLASDMDCP